MSWWIELRCSFIYDGCDSDVHPVMGWVSQRKSLERQARKMGWVKTRKFGWVCPKCHEKKPPQT
jgi:hypothetical protein